MRANGIIVLASASPRRKAFFDQLGVNVEVHRSGVDEESLEAADPETLTLMAARLKVAAVRSKLGADFSGWIIGADTVVALGEVILGKPLNDTDAREMLRRLSGVTHRVVTGYRVESFGGEFREGTVSTFVRFAELSEADIDRYVETGESMDKAGAYAIQCRAAGFVRSISGSYTNVVGLPLFEVLASLKELGAVSE